MTRSVTDESFIRFMEEVPANQLGNLLAEYVNESVHSSWEGFSSSDLTGIRRFLVDVMRYYSAVEDTDHFNLPGFGGVTYFTKKDAP